MRKSDPLCVLSEEVRAKLTGETDAHRQLALRKDLEQRDYQDRLDRLVCGPSNLFGSRRY
jgi:hypothetical protein